MTGKMSPLQIKLWRNAIYFYFALPGVAMASWVSRTPTIRDSLGASTAEMGWILFGLAFGSIIGLLCASHVIAAKGGRFVMVNGTLLSSVGLVIVGIGWAIPSAGVVFAGLVLFGCGTGITDVAMNVEGTAVEHAAKKSLLTGFHAAFSVGTLAGAFTGSAAAKAGISVIVHLGLAAVILAAAAVLLSRCVPKGTGLEGVDGSGEAPMTTMERLAVWKEPRTLLIGLIVLGMAFAEGSANDWLPLAMVDGYKVEPATGSLIYGLFVAAMTLGRATGGFLLDRFGRVTILRASAILAALGLLIVIFGRHYGLAAIGVIFWGLGAAFGFPVGLSAAGDDPRGVAARVGAVTTAGYIAFLVGPPLLGLLGEAVGLLRALLFVLISVSIAGLLSQAAKPVGVRAKALAEKNAL